MDYAATTPQDTAVEKAMRVLYSSVFGNPSSSHSFGQAASRAVFLARQKVAKALTADYKHIVFTGSATEANNMAICGVFDRARTEMNMNNTPLRIVISAIEHDSVYEACARIRERYGAEIIEVPVNARGIIDIKALEVALTPHTIMVSVQMVNSELGVIQPVQKISAIIKQYKTKIGSTVYPVVHTDAVQAFQYIPCNVENLGVDMLTLSGHKIYGPKGIGVLYVKNADILAPQIMGGGQERGIRSGTENVPAIIGFAQAIDDVERIRTKESKRVEKLRAMLWDGITKIIRDAELNGSVTERVPNIISVYFPARSAQDVCIELDMMGVAVSPGTACSSRAAEPSRVIKALGFSGDRPLSSIRFSLGRGTTASEVRSVISILKKRFG